MSQSSSLSRRYLLSGAAKAAAIAPFFVRNLISAPPSQKLRLASFGGGGMAWATLNGIATHPNVTLACVAEVDSARLERVKQQYPDAKLYEDGREMIDRERKHLDIACIGTPDHMHAPQAMASMREGLSVYVQKPLTHDIYEARKLTEMARKKRLVSQMGIQRHSSLEYLRAVKLLQDGVIGKIKEVHTWSNKKWGDLDPFPGGNDPVPTTLRWDFWLGNAPERPFLANYYHPGNWRKRIDFGTATFGDMGCHIYDPVFASLKLTAPISVRSEGPAPSEHNWAINAVIHYVFPGTAMTDGSTVNVTWYDGDAQPSPEVQQRAGVNQLPGQGSIFFGTKGNMLLEHIGMPKLLPEKDFASVTMPEIEPPDHYYQFVDAVLGKAKCSTAFDYSGPLTETVLLGPLATRFPKTTLEWDATRMRVRNLPEANRFLRRDYRKGWDVKGL
ncbi:MAG: Gfo/Idh/MocA family oxidoreductase [Bryobacterales bacterium]|nr:Gfo/Idh/MocA family oxidoreductase [Bryobacterales bacterium]